MCARAGNKQIPVGPHICYKNWEGSSAAMEADIIVQGFKRSVESHNLKYSKIIADGDSSVYAKIQTDVDYGRDVLKIECTNHAIKNYGKALYKIKKESSAGKKILTRDIIRTLQKKAQAAIYANTNGDVGTLKEDLKNSAYHVFDHHLYCKNYLCQQHGKTDESRMPEIEPTGVFHHIQSKCKVIYIYIYRTHNRKIFLLQKTHSYFKHNPPSDGIPIIKDWFRNAKSRERKRQ